MIILFIFSFFTAQAQTHAGGLSQECMDIWMRSNRFSIMDRLERTYLRASGLNEFKEQIQGTVRGSCIKFLPEMVGTSFRDCKVTDVKACEANLTKIHEESYELYKKELIDGAYFNKEVYRPVAPADFFEIMDRYPNVTFAITHTVLTLNFMTDYDVFAQKLCEIPWNCAYRLGNVRYIWENFQLKNLCRIGDSDSAGAGQKDEAALKECETAYMKDLYPKFLEVAKSYGDKTFDSYEQNSINTSKQALENKKQNPSVLKDSLTWEIGVLESDLAYFARTKGQPNTIFYHHEPVILAALAANKKLLSSLPATVVTRVETPAPHTTPTTAATTTTPPATTPPLNAAVTKSLPMGASKLAYLDAEMSNLSDFNCPRNPNFQICKTYESFKADIVPSNMTMLCGQQNCESSYNQLQSAIKQYFKSQIPAKVTEVGANHPTAFISPLMASRFYNLNRTRNVTEKSVYMPFAARYISVKARNEGYQTKVRERYKVELCKTDEQKKAGGDQAACLRFVDELLSSN